MTDEHLKPVTVDDEPPSQPKGGSCRFVNYAAQTKFHEWALLLLAIFTFMFAYLKIGPELDTILANSETAKSNADIAANNADITRLYAEETRRNLKNLEQSATENSARNVPIKAGAAEKLYIVRLSNYNARNCRFAEEDVQKFGDLFGNSKPKIYYQAKDKLAVVGVPTGEQKAANDIVKTAQNQAKHFPAENLDRASVKLNPDWIETTCQTINK